MKAPLRKIEGGKHFTPEDHPEIVAEEIQVLVDAADRHDLPAGLDAGASCATATL